MRHKLYFILLMFLIFLGCSEKKEHRNIENYKTIEIGDGMTDVVEKMGIRPEKVIIPDSFYLNQVLHKNLTTFLYKTPRFASSNIHIYFENCQVLHIYYD